MTEDNFVDFSLVAIYDENKELEKKGYKLCYACGDYFPRSSMHDSTTCRECHDYFHD